MRRTSLLLCLVAGCGSSSGTAIDGGERPDGGPVGIDAGPRPDAPPIDDASAYVSIGEQAQLISGLNWDVDSVYADWSIRRSPSGKIYRFEIREGDQRPGEDRDRSELSGSEHKYPNGTELWLSYSFLHEPGAPLVDEWNNMGQWHAGSGSPVVTFKMHDEGQFAVWTRSGSSGDHVDAVRYQMTDFQRGRWYGVVQRLRFDPDGSDAIVQVWMDGVLVVDVQGEPVSYTDSTETYWKFGIYREASAVTQAVRFANFEFSTTSLADRIDAPLPIDP
jgi:hypothetical protein